MTPSESSPRSQPIASAVCDDGTIVEMLYRREGHETCLACFHDGGVEERTWVELPRLGRAVPYSATNNLLTHGVILFPSTAAEYDDQDSLVADVRAFIHRYADLTEVFEEIASYYILLSWVFDAFNEVPYLRLKGDFGSGKSRCLQTIGSLCYKPMFVSGASTVSPMFRIIDAFRGTLILDESDFRFSDEKAEIVKILNNGNAAGFPVLRSEATPTKEFNPRAFDVFGPKVIASRSLFEDRALESRCITETMTGLPPRPDIPLSLPKTFRREATELRNKLLMYRFRTLHSVTSDAVYQETGMEPRVAQVFAPLLALVEDEPTRKRIRALARGQTGSIRSERSDSIEAQLLGIMFEMRRDSVILSVKEIADRFAERFGSDFLRPITPRWIGSQLRRRLSLVPMKNHGIFVIPDEQQTVIERLCERFDVGPSGDVGRLGTSTDIADTDQGLNEPALVA
jgi:hypothetical protein